MNSAGPEPIRCPHQQPRPHRLYSRIAQHHPQAALHPALKNSFAFRWKYADPPLITVGGPRHFQLLGLRLDPTQSLVGRQFEFSGFLFG